MPATLAIVVTPQNAPSDGSADQLDQVLIPLVQELAAKSSATVVVGSSSGSGAGSPIAVLRSNNVSNQVSTVDDADLVSGQTVAIQALAARLATGKVGSYGFTANGATAVAPSPAPTPTASPSATPTRLVDQEEGKIMSSQCRLIASAAAGAAAAGAARLAYSAMNRRPPGGPKVWSRTNHRGEPVTLLEGPAVAAGAIAGVLARRLTGSASWRASAAIAVGGAGAAAFGAYDDLAGSGDRRGFRGHLGALRHGEVTTGAVKLGGIGATGIVSAVLAGGSPADVVINAGLVAGGANLLNLFDLRPGRAIKVAVASGALIGAAGQDSVAAPLAAALALLPEDLGERAMLGDAGANALGAMLGASAAACPGRPGSRCSPGSSG